MSRWAHSLALPHVTETIKAAGLLEGLEHVGAEHLEFGTAVHLATQLDDEGDLDEGDLDPRLLPRLESWRRFRAESGVEILAIEEPVQDLRWRYCGTVDRRVRLNGREGVLDIKGPTAMPWQGVQLAAYANAYGRPMAAWSLHLADDGYRLKEHPDADGLHFKAFCAALTLGRWKEKHAPVKKV